MKGLAAAWSLFAAASSLFAASALGAGCAADCVKSADIQVTVVATAGVQLSSVARLHLRMSVNDGPMRQLDITPQAKLTGSETSLLLRPDPPPAQKYSLALTVEAYDAQGQLLGVGTGGGDALALGCNRFDARLAPLGLGGDGGMSVDGPAPPDLSAGDLANCFGGMPDEDQDGRANGCDLCPADSDPTPVDADGDGLPDACDPDPARSGNRLLYFEPFDLTAPHWSGTYTVAPNPQGWLNVDTNGTNTVLVGNGVDALQPNVRVQTNLFFKGYYIPFQGAPVDADAALFLGSADGRNGVMCFVNKDQQRGDSLQLAVVQGGSVNGLSPQPLNVQSQTVYRLRLSQRGNLYECEAAAAGQSGTTVTAQLSPLPAPVFMTLRVRSAEANFQSVVAESVLP